MRIGTIKLGLTAATVLLAATLGYGRTAPISSFKSNILVLRDGTAIVVESITVAAKGDFERRFPMQFDTLISRRRLLIDVLEVKDGNARPLSYLLRRSGAWLVVRVSGVTRDLTFSYAVRNAVRFAVDHDEFLWPVNPPGTSADEVSARVHLPDELAGEFTAQAFLRRDSPDIPLVAQWSSDGRLPVIMQATDLTAGSPGPLAPGITLVVDVFAPKGILRPPSSALRGWWFAQSNPIIFLPVIALGMMLIIRRLKGKDAEPGRSVAPMYTPPENLTPAECGALIDDSVDPRDIAATLVDLARRGYVRIEEPSQEQQQQIRERDLVLRLLKPMPEWHGLAAHEYTMLFHTFYGGQWTMLSSLRLRFPDIVPSMRSQIFASLRRRGMYRTDPEQVQGYRFAIFLLLSLVLIDVERLTQGELFASPVLGVSMFALASGIVFVLGRNLTAKTFRGMRAYVAVLGLREFISSVERDRLEQVDATNFEKLLPYAMALGIEHKLTHGFRGVATKAPDWYGWTEKAEFDSVRFGHRMDVITASTRLNRYCQPRGTKPLSRLATQNEKGRAASA